MAGCGEGAGPLPAARRVDHRSPVVSSAAVQVPGLPAHYQGGQTPTSHDLAGLLRDSNGFGEKEHLFF